MRTRGHWVLVGASVAYVGVAATLAFVVPTQTSDGVTGSLLPDGTTTEVATSEHLTLYQVNGTPVVVIVAALGLACLVAAASVAVRASRRSTRLGIGCLVVSLGVGLVGLLGLLTIGIVLLPLVVLLLLVAQPISYDEPVAPVAPVDLEPEPPVVSSG